MLWIAWVGISAFYFFIALSSFRSWWCIAKELQTLSDEGGLKLARKRGIEMEPLDLGKFTLMQLKKLQVAGWLGSAIAMLAAIISVSN